MKKISIHVAVVAAETVGDLINQIRNEENKAVNPNKAKTADNAVDSQKEGKKIIPEAVVSVDPESSDTVGDLINQMREENKTKEDPLANEKQKGGKETSISEKKIIPEAIVSRED